MTDMQVAEELSNKGRARDNNNKVTSVRRRVIVEEDGRRQQVLVRHKLLARQL